MGLRLVFNLQPRGFESACSSTSALGNERQSFSVSCAYMRECHNTISIKSSAIFRQSPLNSGTENKDSLNDCPCLHPSLLYLSHFKLHSWNFHTLSPFQARHKIPPSKLSVLISKKIILFGEIAFVRHWKPITKT